MSEGKPIQTAEGRLEILRQAARDFSKHLETVPGAALPPTLRLQVASCARNALSCKACAELQQTCLPKSESLYSTCSGASHGPQITGEKNEAIVSCVTSIIHAVVNQQSKLNEVWFADSIKAIKESGLIPEGLHNEEGMDLAYYSAFAEIVALSSMSVGFQQAFTTLEESVPPLPTKAAPGPLNVNFSSMLKRVRRDESIVAMPYYLSSDIDKTSIEWKKLREVTRNKISFQLNPMSPAIGLCMAPEDLMTFDRYMGAAYMKSGYVSREDWLTKIQSCAELSLTNIHRFFHQTEGSHDVDSVGYESILSIGLSS